MNLKQSILEIKNSELIRGSLILLILLNIGNVLNYLFQVSMARMLGPEDYGVFAVLTSIIYIFNVPTISIQTIVSKHTTRLLVKKELGKIKGFFEFMTKKTFFMALVIYLVYLPFSFFLSKKLNISIGLLILTGTFVFGAFLYPVALGILQGMKKFSVWGWNSLIGYVIKLLLGIILVFIGFKVYGAILGFILGTLFSFFLVIPYMRRIINLEKIDEKIKIFSKEVIATFMAMLIIVLIYSTDVIFARLFFASDVVGKYAVISMIGKIIMFGAMGIGNAMFPISSERFEAGDKTRSIFKKAFFATFLWCIGLIFIFGFFPNLVIRLLFGAQYLDLRSILLYIGIAFSFISFTNLLVLYKISNNKFKLKHVFVLGIFLAMQFLAFYFFRKEIYSFSLGFMFSTIITFIGSIILIRK